MRQRHSHPPFVVKVDAGCEIEEIQIVLGVSVAGFAPLHRSRTVPGDIGVFED
jgi:hypothetical protein